jgi:hypothetical protein
LEPLQETDIRNVRVWVLTLRWVGSMRGRSISVWCRRRSSSSPNCFATFLEAALISRGVAPGWGSSLLCIKPKRLACWGGGRRSGEGVGGEGKGGGRRRGGGEGRWGRGERLPPGTETRLHHCPRCCLETPFSTHLQSHAMGDEQSVQDATWGREEAGIDRRGEGPTFMQRTLGG